MNSRRTSSSSGTSRFPSLLKNNATAAVPLPSSSSSSRRSYVALRIPAQQKQLQKQLQKQRQPPSPPCVDCPICCEVLVLPVSTVSCCQKVFCFFCIVHRSVTSCPMCRAPLPSVHESFVLRSPFSDLEVKIYGDKGRWERRLMAIAGRVAQISVAAVLLALPPPAASAVSLLEKKTIDSLHHSILSATGVVKSQVALYDALRKRDASPSETAEMTTLVKASLDAVVRLIQGATDNNDDDDNGVARLAAASLRELFSFGSASGGDVASSSVSEQCAMFFAGGFMRRRAPSLIVVSGDDDSDDAGEPRQKNTAIQNRKSVQTNQKSTRNSTTEMDDEAGHLGTVSSLPSAATGQWRVQLRQRIERRKEVTSTKFPVLIDVQVDDEDANTTTTNNVATAAKPRREANECVQEVVEGSPDDTCDLVLLNAAHHHHGGRDRCAFSSHRTNPDDRSLGLFQKRAALMSADTRVQSDLRLQIKLASAYAEKKTMKSKLRNGQ